MLVTALILCISEVSVSVDALTCPSECSRYIRDQEMFPDAYQGELFDET
jgi:hypothetical protein